MIDDLTDVLCSDDYAAVDTIKKNLGSISRLGRSADILSVFSCFKLSGDIASSSGSMVANSMVILFSPATPNDSVLAFDKDTTSLMTDEPHTSVLGIYTSQYNFKAYQASSAD